MSNAYFRKDDLKSRKGWQARLAQALNDRATFPDYTFLPDALSQQVLMVRPGPFRAPDARLILTRDDEGLAVGFACHKGYLRAGRPEWQLGPDWDWHRLIRLLNGSTEFLGLLAQAKGGLPDAAFWITSGEGDPETLNVYATGLPLGALVGLLNAWPAHLWCELSFGVHLDQDALLKASDTGVLERLEEILTRLEPLLRAFTVPIEPLASGTAPPAGSAPRA